eukprot:scaffold27723_cov101-Isochrysis_galbana.AAC.1
MARLLARSAAWPRPSLPCRRGFFWGGWGGGDQRGPAGRSLAPAAVVAAWMGDPTLVSARLSVWRRTELYLALRMLPGLDLPEFLRGARGAYPVVCSLMYARDWEALQPLVSPRCLEAMRGAMDTMGDNAQRVVMPHQSGGDTGGMLGGETAGGLGGDTDGGIEVVGCTLQAAHILRRP